MRYIIPTWILTPLSSISINKNYMSLFIMEISFRIAFCLLVVPHWQCLFTYYWCRDGNICYGVVVYIHQFHTSIRVIFTDSQWERSISSVTWTIYVHVSTARLVYFDLVVFIVQSKIPRILNYMIQNIRLAISNAQECRILHSVTCLNVSGVLKVFLSIWPNWSVGIVIRTV